MVPSEFLFITTFDDPRYFQSTLHFLYRPRNKSPPLGTKNHSYNTRETFSKSFIRPQGKRSICYPSIGRCYGSRSGSEATRIWIVVRTILRVKVTVHHCGRVEVRIFVKIIVERKERKEIEGFESRLVPLALEQMHLTWINNRWTVISSYLDSIR